RCRPERLALGSRPGRTDAPPSQPLLRYVSPSSAVFRPGRIGLGDVHAVRQYPAAGQNHGRLLEGLLRAHDPAIRGDVREIAPEGESRREVALRQRQGIPALLSKVKRSADLQVRIFIGRYN